ncbi:MAG: hypothetical protein V4727_07245, partial [Verrucomicrobiota bacterium]
MTKNTSITASILIVGGCSLYLIHQKNEQVAARVEQIVSQRNSLPDTSAGRHSSRPFATTRLTTTNKIRRNSATHAQLLKELNEYLKGRGHSEYISQAGSEEFGEEILSMDVKSLTELMLQAKQVQDPHENLISFIIESFSEKDPAEATLLAANHVTTTSPFNENLSRALGVAFEAWMKSDPAAAEKWYTDALSSGELIPKSIPKRRAEQSLPAHVLAQSRRSAFLNADPEQAEIIFNNLERSEAVSLLSSSSPEHIARFVTQLDPEQQFLVLSPRLSVMVRADFKQAAEWLNSLAIAESTRGDLMAHAAQKAYQAGQLTRADTLKMFDGLPESSQTMAAKQKVESDANIMALMASTGSRSNVPIPGGPITDDPITDDPITDGRITVGSMPVSPMPVSPMPVGPMPVGPTPDGPTPDGPTPDGPTPDGPIPDGPIPDGPIPDGPIPDG